MADVLSGLDSSKWQAYRKKYLNIVNARNQQKHKAKLRQRVLEDAKQKDQEEAPSVLQQFKGTAVTGAPLPEASRIVAKDRREPYSAADLGSDHAAPQSDALRRSSRRRQPPFKLL